MHNSQSYDIFVKGNKIVAKQQTSLLSMFQCADAFYRAGIGIAAEHIVLHLYKSSKILSMMWSLKVEDIRS